MSQEEWFELLDRLQKKQDQKKNKPQPIDQVFPDIYF